VSRLPRPARCAVPAAGYSGRPELRLRRRRARAGPCRAAIIAPALAALALAASGCDGGPIAQDTPVSSGQSYVSGSNLVVFKAGNRPVAPAVSGTTLAGKALSLAAYHGDVVVLNFWGSWCPPCRAEAPALGTLSRQLSGRGVRFVGVDIRDEPDAALAFMQDFNIGYPSLNDPNDDIALLFHATVPPQAIPSTVIIDRSGRIAALIVGGVTYSSLRPLITNVAAGSS
jgi:thiol-disulfide isomerase/thioredoxin